jgi:hypothetical protein
MRERACPTSRGAAVLAAADFPSFVARLLVLSFFSTNQNQNKKAHKNGIHKPKFHRFVSLKQVRALSAAAASPWTARNGTLLPLSTIVACAHR